MERKIGRIHSAVTKIDMFENLSDIERYIKRPSWVTAYLDNRILIGKYEDGQFIFWENHILKIEFVQKIRLFNEDEELLIWRGRGTHKGRYRKDGDGGEDIDFLDTCQIVLGTSIELKQNGFVCLTEEKGTSIILPDDNFSSNEKNRVAIRTRNYINFKGNYDCQASFVDVRFLKFVSCSAEED